MNSSNEDVILVKESLIKMRRQRLSESSLRQMPREKAESYDKLDRLSKGLIKVINGLIKSE